MEFSIYFGDGSTDQLNKHLTTKDDDDVDLAMNILSENGYISSKDIKNHPILGPRYAGKRWRVSALLDKVAARCNCQEAKMGRGSRRYLYTEKGKEAIMEIARESRGRNDSRYVRDRLKQMHEILEGVDWEKPLRLRELAMENIDMSLTQFDNLVSEMKKVPAFKEYRVYTGQDGIQYVYQKNSDAEKSVTEAARRVVEKAKSKIREEKHLFADWRTWIETPMPPQLINQMDEEIKDFKQTKKQERVKQLKKKREEVVREYRNLREEGKEPGEEWYKRKAAEHDERPGVLRVWTKEKEKEEEDQ